MQQPESAERWAWLAEHGDALRRTLRRRLGVDEADDVASEAILRAGRSTVSVPPGARRAAWLHRIARNVAIDRWRRDRRLVPLEIAAHVTAEPNMSAARIDVEVALKRLRSSDRPLSPLVPGGPPYNED